MAIRWQLTAVTLCVILTTASTLHAEINRWDGGGVIPGTEGITPGPGVQLDHRALEYAGLGGIDLTGSNLDFSNLTNAYLWYSTLTNAGLTGANLTNANLRESVLMNANLTGANLANANVDGSTLTNANLTGADVAGTSFGETTSRGFTAAQLYSTQSYQSKDLRGIGLRRNDLAGWDFSGQNLTNAHLGDSTLTNANLTGAVVTGTRFYNTTSRGFTNSQLASTASYQAKNLQGIWLSGNDLSGWDFSDQDLSGAGFGRLIFANGSNLTGANLTGANLTNASLQITILTDAALMHSNLTGADLGLSTLINANLTGAAVIGANFYDTTEYGFNKEQLYSTHSYQTKDLRAIDLESNDLTGWDFSGQNLTNADLSSTLNSANLTGALVTWTRFGGTTPRGFTAAQLYSTQSYQEKNLSGIGLWDNDLTGWDFSGQNLTNADLFRSTLTNANMTGAFVTGTSFKYATGFTAAQLYSTQSYQENNLSGIGLSENDLTGWDFSGQNLTNASLSSSTLTNANLTGADLKNVYLVDAIGLSAAEFSPTSVYNQWTVFPASFNPAAAGLTKVISPPGDLDANGTLTAADVDRLANRIGHRWNQWNQTSWWLPDAAFDVNGDSLVSVEDHRAWVKDLKHTWFGDANLNGEFNSDDLVLAFQAGKFDVEPIWGDVVGKLLNPASWSEGDWNGDGLFSSDDFVIAFQDGGYEMGPRTDVAAAPEPGESHLYALVLLIAYLCSRRARTPRPDSVVEQKWSLRHSRTTPVRAKHAALFILLLFLVITVPVYSQTFQLTEATVWDINRAFDAGVLTSEQLVQMYLNRIEAYEAQGPNLNAFIAVNSQALATARDLDIERQTKGARSPLHGVPVVIKDLIDTYDMPTTAGSLCFGTEVMPPDDATVVKRLRDAGAVIIGKSNPDEFGWGFEGFGYSRLGGQSRNPYDTRRTPGGSSGGTAVAVAANLTALGIGSDTANSIRNPASWTNQVGILPTTGLVSYDGSIGIARFRDHNGPMSRTVSDAALLLDAIAGFDPADPRTADSIGRIPETYLSFLDKDGLRGARIGIATAFTMGARRIVEPLMEAAVSAMQAQGAEVVRNVVIDGLPNYASDPTVTWYLSMEYDYNRYLESLGTTAPYASLRDLLACPQLPLGMKETFLERMRGDRPPEEDPLFAKYMEMRQRATDGILQAMETYDLDAIVHASGYVPANLIGQPYSIPNPGWPADDLTPFVGFPAIVVPAGFTAAGLPIGIEFMGRPFDEPTLLRLAYAYEQASQLRQPPASAPPLDGETRSLGVPGDFTADGKVDVSDIDTMSGAIRAGSRSLVFDLNRDWYVDSQDRMIWIHDLRKTWLGDANLNGEFNSSDMAQGLAGGKYETGYESGWSEGDWNGDLVFDSADFITAFQDGGYEMGLRTDVAAVPEPAGVVLLILGLAAVMWRKTTAQNRV